MAPTPDKPLEKDLLQLATEAFGGRDKALEWLNKPHDLLGGKSPLQWADGGPGEGQVREMLASLRFGGVV